MASGVTDIIVRSQAGLTQRIDVRGHQLMADEPKDQGGNDAGPNPYELLLSALGSCTAITVRMYAQRKGWPLESIEVALQHERIHAEDCAQCDTNEGFLDRITKLITLRGPLDAEQRQRLMDVSERCPVQKTLQHEVHIESRFIPGD
jgi:putative redox protein